MRILGIGTYPIDAPRHGGQRRAAAIRDGLINAGHDFRYVSFYQQDGYPAPQDPHYAFALPAEEIGRLVAEGKRPDAHVAELILDDPARKERFKALLKSFRPQAILYEQPWGFPVVEALADALEDGVLHLYSSQNVESALIERILTRENHPATDRITEEVRQLEGRLLATASLTFVVSRDDQEAFAASAPGAKIILAPNGSNPPEATPEVEKAWLNSRPPGTRHAAFVGSAHPPNAHGFMDLLGPNLGYIPYPHRLLVAGGVVHLLKNPWNRFGPLNESILERHPGPSDEELGAILKSAAAILLPITEGGGSNLKTAEALLSDRPVVATTLAFRGFEEMKRQPGVFIADDPKSFKAKIGELLMEDNPQPCGRDPEALARLRWEACLAPMLAAMETLP